MRRLKTIFWLLYVEACFIVGVFIADYLQPTKEIINLY